MTTRKQFANSTMPSTPPVLVEPTATPDTAAGYPPYAPVTKRGPLSVVDAVTAGRDLRSRRKILPVKRGPRLANAKGPRVTDVRMSRRAARAHERCLQKHEAVLSGRVERMSRPPRRALIDMWRERADMLPASTIARLRSMLDADEPFKPDQAYQFFLNLRRNPKNRGRAKKMDKCQWKDLLSMITDKRFMRTQNAIVAFAKGVQQRLIKPTHYELVDGMRRLSDIVLGEINMCKCPHRQSPLKRSTNAKAKFYMEMADKIAVWIDQILLDSDEHMLMMDSEEDEDLLYSESGDTGFDDKSGRKRRRANLLPYDKGPAFRLLVKTMRDNPNEMLCTKDKSKKNFGQGATDLVKAKRLDVNHDDPNLSKSINSILSKAVEKVTPPELKNEMADTVAKCAKYLSQLDVDKNERGPAFETMIKELKKLGDQEFDPATPQLSTQDDVANVLQEAPGLSNVTPDKSTAKKYEQMLHKAVDSGTPPEQKEEMDGLYKRAANYISAFARDGGTVLQNDLERKPTEGVGSVAQKTTRAPSDGKTAGPEKQNETQEKMMDTTSDNQQKDQLQAQGVSAETTRAPTDGKETQGKMKDTTPDKQQKDQLQAQGVPAQELRNTGLTAEQAANMSPKEKGQALAGMSPEEGRKLMSTMTPDDIKNMLAGMPEQDRKNMLAAMTPNEIKDLIAGMSEEEKRKFLADLSPEELKKVLAGMSDEEIKKLMAGMTDEGRQKFLASLPEAERNRLMGIDGKKAITPEESKKLMDQMNDMSPKEKRTFLENMSPSEKKDFLARMSDEEKRKCLAGLPPEDRNKFLSGMSPDEINNLMAVMPDAEKTINVAGISAAEKNKLPLASMSPDEIKNLMTGMSDDEMRKAIAGLSPEEMKKVLAGMSPEEIGRLMDGMTDEEKRKFLASLSDEDRKRLLAGLPEEERKRLEREARMDDPMTEDARQILHKQLRAKGDAIFHSQDQTTLTHGQASDWLTHPKSVEESVRNAGDTARLAEEFEKKLDANVKSVTPARLADAMNDVVIDSARTCAERFISENMKANVRDGLIAEMQKHANEILIEIDGAAETSFFAAQRLKRGEAVEAKEPRNNEVIYRLEKKLKEIVRCRRMPRRILKTIREIIKDTAEYLSVLVTKPDEKIEAYVALLGEMEAAGDSLLVEGKIPKSYKDAAAYLHQLTSYEDKFGRSDKSLQSEIEKKLKNLMANVSSNGYSRKAMADVITESTKLLVSYIVFQGERTEALNVLVDKMYEMGDGVLLRHGNIHRTYQEAADLLEGINTDQLQVENADYVVVRKIQMKLNNLMQNHPLDKHHALMNDVIADTTMYLAVTLLNPHIVQVCKCMKNVFVQCELWCEEMMRRVSRPCCTCSRYVSVAALQDLAPRQCIMINRGSSRAYVPSGLQINLKDCPTYLKLQDDDNVHPTPSCQAKGHSIAYLVHSTAYNKFSDNYSNLTRLSSTIPTNRILQVDSTANLAHSSPALTNSTSLDTETASHISSSATHTSDDESKQKPYWQSSTVMYASIARDSLAPKRPEQTLHDIDEILNVEAIQNVHTQTDNSNAQADCHTNSQDMCDMRVQCDTNTRWRANLLCNSETHGDYNLQVRRGTSAKTFDDNNVPAYRCNVIASHDNNALAPGEAGTHCDVIAREQTATKTQSNSCSNAHAPGDTNTQAPFDINLHVHYANPQAERDIDEESCSVIQIQVQHGNMEHNFKTSERVSSGPHARFIDNSAKGHRTVLHHDIHSDTNAKLRRNINAKLYRDLNAKTRGDVNAKPLDSYAKARRDINAKARSIIIKQTLRDIKIKACRDVHSTAHRDDHSPIRRDFHSLTRDVHSPTHRDVHSPTRDVHSSTHRNIHSSTRHDVHSPTRRAQHSPTRNDLSPTRRGFHTRTLREFHSPTGRRGVHSPTRDAIAGYDVNQHIIPEISENLGLLNVENGPHIRHNARAPIVGTDQMLDRHAMMVSLMWNVHAWRDWIQDIINRGQTYQPKENVSQKEAEADWANFQKRVTIEAQQWRLYNSFSKQLTLRLSCRYSQQQMGTPTRHTVKTQVYMECQRQLIKIIGMFKRWTHLFMLIIKEIDTLKPDTETPLHVLRWLQFKKKVNQYSQDWSKYNSLLKSCWEYKYKHIMAEWIPAWKSSVPVWVVCACGAVPSGAVAAGLVAGEVIWVARTTHRHNVMPAGLVPSKHCCLVYADGEEHHYTKYQVMCNANVSWKAWRTREMGPQAVRVAPGVFVGRVLYRGSHLVGAVLAPHYRCHVVVLDRPFAFNCYELLVTAPEDENL